MSFNKIEQNCVIWFAVYAKDGVGTSVEFFYLFFHVTFESLSGLQSHAKVIPLIDPLYETLRLMFSPSVPPAVRSWRVLVTYMYELICKVFKKFP